MGTPPERITVHNLTIRDQDQRRDGGDVEFAHAVTLSEAIETDAYQEIESPIF